ncbi:hypothetical protein HZ326_7324 [Fusarium oxysporum f. sp. albedinis]|nr:hypothetical protein HZ326_7324 [Fusarium oxysporum f. sp. albedinis]
MAEDSVTSFNKNARLDALHDFIEQHGSLVNVFSNVIMDFSISDYEIVVDSHSPAPPIRPRDELQTVDSSYLRGIVDMGR